jgi:competence protein ComEC
VMSVDRLRRQGAIALRRTRDGFALEAVRPRGVDRPWSPAPAGDSAEDDVSLVPRSPGSRTIDATPSEADLQAEE